MPKDLLAIVGIALTFIAYIPYIYSIFQKKTKPHVFSWAIWGGTTFIVFLAQLSDEGGAGAWVIGVSACLVMCIAILAFIKKSDITIFKSDWYFLFIAIVASMFWYFSSDPLWTVIILTIMNVVGFGPTLKKAYANPFEENLNFFLIVAVRNTVSVMALENYSLTTVFFPVVTAIACLAVVLIMAYRKSTFVRT
ncbi:hypothetical protein HR060_00370 [Catenovulum sp. SM1970]|uniref:hypothetical protein n=1 Tax=Marinifaba aquimaris TaxID=2741323 RepID=UPI001574BE08|nr:hypothetical protein [Marinifaba aquimaris]NTS75303.1 hypothetical protein [Marinifaba aquimaris]